MKTPTAVAVVGATALAALLALAVPASAVPADAASCAGQLSQGATPHGASESAPGFLGDFLSATASSQPGAVGESSRTFSRQHGDLGACLPF